MAVPASALHEPELEPGLVIADRYRLDRLIGEGGMGSVWAASHMVTRRAVALKFLRCSGASEESRHRFMREARAACAVMHPNVVEVLDFLGAEGDAPTMVMELLEGESLAKLLARVGRLSVSQTADIMSCVVSAVGTAHAEGIIHRDLKPDNIFLQRERDGSSRVKVLDFGVAKVTVVDGDALATADLTRRGALLGTPMYMSPEQVFGESDLDHRADVWSIGLILYQCLCGVLPTAAGNSGQVFKIIVSGTIKPVLEVSPEVPAGLASLIDKMLSRDRDGRPEDLRPVLAALQSYAKQPALPFGPPRSGSRRGAETGSCPTLSTTGEPDQDGLGTLVLTGDVQPAPREAPDDTVAPVATRSRWLLLAGTVAVGSLVVLGAVLAAGQLASRALQDPVTAAESRNIPSAPDAAAVDSSPPTVPAYAASALPSPSEAHTSTADSADTTRKRSVPASIRQKKPPAVVAPGPRPGSTTHPEDPYGF